MKFILALLAVPAVMGRACRPRKSSAAAIATRSAAAKVSSVQNDYYQQPAAATTSSTSTTSTSIVVAVSSTSAYAAPASSTSAEEAEPSSTGGSTSGGTSYTGTSTFYGGNLAGGNCMFTNYTLPSGTYGTAYSGAVWNNAAMCGACIEVTGPTHTVKAMIVDQCPECAQGHLDLFPSAFTAIGGTDGTVSTSYKFVECGITSPIIIKNKEGTSVSWFSMEVYNHNEPVKSLEVSTDGGSSWTATTRRSYNFFEKAKGFLVEKTKVRVTSTSGKTVVLSGVGTAPGAQFTATGNF